MPNTVPPLTLRIPKMAPLSAVEGDNNLKILRDFCNSLAALYELVFNLDGTIRNNVVTTLSIRDRAVTQPKLDWLANFFAVAVGTDVYTATINPTAAFSYGDGLTTSFIAPIFFTNANTGASTLEINGAGAKPIKKGSGVDLVAGDIPATSIGFIAFDGTNIRLLNPQSATVAFINGVLSNGTGTDNVTVLGVGDTLIGTHQLGLPAGRRWTWVKHVFSTSISAIPQQGIDQIKVKLTADVMSWVNNHSASGYLTGGTGNDIYQVTFITEGPPTGHETDANLTVNLFARQKSGVGDTPAARKMYSVAWYQ